MPIEIDPLLYMTIEQFSYLMGLAGIGCGLIFAYALIEST